MTDRPPARVFEKEAMAFADKWSRLASGQQTLAKTCDLAFAIGKELGFSMKESALLATPLETMFGQEGYTPRSFFRVGLHLLSNRKTYKEGGTPEADLSGLWTVIHITDMLPAGRSKKGRKLWSVCCLVMAGPLAGKEFSTTITDSYLASLVRAVSGAKWSKTVAGCDAFNMRLRAKIGQVGGNLAILQIDDQWAPARKMNSELRRRREDCPKGPCDRCNKGADECPYAIRKKSVRREETTHGVSTGGPAGLPVEGEGHQRMVPGSGESGSRDDGGVLSGPDGREGGGVVHGSDNGAS